MSLRTKSDNDGNGPIVSVWLTVHDAVFVGGGVGLVGGAVVVVVRGLVVAMVVGLVVESLLHAEDHAAPATVSNPRASRRLHAFFVRSDMFACSKWDIKIEIGGS